MDCIPMMGDLKLQSIGINMRCNAGVLQHAYTTPFGGKPWLAIADKFRNKSADWTNTPTLGAGQGFVNGVGVVNERIVFDTEPLNVLAPRIMDHVTLSYYQGNNTRVLPIAGFRSVNVLGDTQLRFCICLYNYGTGAAVNVTAAGWLGGINLAQGYFQYFGFL